jgi:hypothetical protein
MRKMAVIKGSALNTSKGPLKDIDLQRRIAEKNSDRRLRFVTYCAVIGFLGGLAVVWLSGCQLIWLGVFASLGGLCGFALNEFTLKTRASCPSCGGSWEMESLNREGVPNEQFYMKHCPFCKTKISE